MTQNPPNTLGRSGRKLWRSLTEGFEFRPDELRILESACSMSDTIDEYEKAIETEPLMVRGSAGQQVLHPIRAEIRALRMSQATLLGRLNIPDAEDEEEVEGIVRKLTRSEVGRKAANARWNK